MEADYDNMHKLLGIPLGFRSPDQLGKGKPNFEHYEHLWALQQQSGVLGRFQKLYHFKEGKFDNWRGSKLYFWSTSNMGTKGEN